MLLNLLKLKSISFNFGQYLIKFLLPNSLILFPSKSNFSKEGQIKNKFELLIDILFSFKSRNLRWGKKIFSGRASILF